MRTKAGIDPFFTRESVAANDALYLAGQKPNHPWASPATSANLRGLPPMLLQAGTNEILLDDAVRLAARARDAEVDVILDITAGVPHVFQLYTDVLDEANQALDRAALFVIQHLR
jgi:acetyl esterase/lipase